MMPNLDRAKNKHITTPSTTYQSRKHNNCWILEILTYLFQLGSAFSICTSFRMPILLFYERFSSINLNILC